MIRPKHAVCSFVGMMLLTSSASSIQAEILVSRARGVTGATVGNRFPDDHVFRLPPNSELRLLRTPDNNAFVMRGPFEGTLSNFVANCSGVSAWMYDYCKDRGEGPLLGGTRGPVRTPQ